MADAEGYIFWIQRPAGNDYTGTTLEEMEGWGMAEGSSILMRWAVWSSAIEARFRTSVAGVVHRLDLSGRTSSHGSVDGEGHLVDQGRPKPCIWFNVKAPADNVGVAEIVEVCSQLGGSRKVLSCSRSITQSVVASGGLLLNLNNCAYKSA